jgi:outer membrane protein OmpA-like peptidoglycan-associated protein
MRIALLALCTFGLFGIGRTQDKPGPIKQGTLAIQLGAFDFQTAQKIRTQSLSSVLGNKEWSNLSESDMAFGISYIKGISKFFDYSINGYLGSVAYPVRNSNGTANTNTTSKLLFEVDGSIHMKLLPDNFIVVPYLSAGLGGSAWNGRFEAFAPLGAGLQFGIGEEYFAFSNFQYRVPVTQGANYHFLYSLGFGGPIGKPREPEVKEVPPAPVVVAAVPVDTDGDGIIDAEDKCPTVPGVAKYQGCPVPDTDGDGIKDDVDKCPTVAGVAQYGGCPVPDTDGDGIKDDVDKCPTVPGLERYQGCPIPDTDGDGLNDEEDKCPTVPGIAELRGCPRPPFKAENVLFATGKATLVVRGKQELDILVPYFTENAGVNVTIEGHTDNTGNDKINQKLSEQRAAAAKAYLVSKGIDASRMTTVGYGATKPIADNKTAEGRKMNRRVHFTINE